MKKRRRFSCRNAMHLGMSVANDLFVTSNAHQLEKEEIAEDLLAYLTDHPDARDTLEGIVRWWLLERRVERAAALVENVLRELVEKGLVQKIEGAHHTVQYSISA